MHDLDDVRAFRQSASHRDHVKFRRSAGRGQHNKCFTLAIARQGIGWLAINRNDQVGEVIITAQHDTKVRTLKLNRDAIRDRLDGFPPRWPPGIRSQLAKTPVF